MVILTIISIVLNVVFLTIGIYVFFKIKNSKKDMESIIDEKIFNDFFNGRI